MIKFKLISVGISPQERKNYLPKCKKLPMPFTLNDVKPGMFSDAILKRLKSAKKHGMEIPIRRGGGYYLAIEVINKDDLKSRKNNEANLKRKIKRLMKKEDVIDFWNTLLDLATKGKAKMPEFKW